MTKIAILGIGTVGSGTADIFEDNADVIWKNTGEEVQVKYILCRRMRPESRFADRIVLDFDTIESDPEIRVVAECMGGVHPAYDYAVRAMKAGKHVVTSNKQLVAECGLELTRLAKEQGVCFLFEGSVGGGIPVLRPITRCLAANRIDSVYGILNGTTNYILTEMIQCGKSFAQALSEAQEKGYAELDPTADVEGIDACRKICILADMCFGYNVDPAQVRTQGISAITSADVDYARRMGYRIKLLGRTLRLPDGRVTAYVAPHFVEKENPIVNVDGVINGIVIHGNAVGNTVFCGPGAGAAETGSAVAADILDCLTQPLNRQPAWEPQPEGYFMDADELPMRWFVRVKADLGGIEAAFGNVHFVSIPGADPAEYAFPTEPMSAKALAEAGQGLEITAAYRILDE